MERMTVRDAVNAVNGVLASGKQDTVLKRVSIDSREIGEDTLFVPLVGQCRDAHDFIEQAVGSGARAVFSSRSASELNWNHEDVALIQVEDTLQALQRLGASYRRKFKIPVIGVTGSVGKTSTREMISAALSAGFDVFKTSGNYNSQVGLPLTLCELTQEKQIAVLELGMSEPGELAVIAEIAAPSMAVITNIGVAHLEQLGTRENICHEKMSIQNGFGSKGTLLLNGDDELLRDRRANPGFRTLFYGTGSHCDYRAEDIGRFNGYPVFRAVCDDESVEVQLNVFGHHNILNALAALAVARENGVSMEKAAAALKSYKGFQGRQQILEKNGVLMIDDSYNASPDSMKAAISVLKAIPVKGKKTAVLADMLELGADSARFHYEVGEYLASNPSDELLLLGERAKEIGRAVREKNAAVSVREFADSEDLGVYLRKSISEGDAVLFKGSNSMKLGELVNKLTESR